MLGDWFENEKTGEIMNVKGQSSVPASEQGKGWVNIGKDDMFGKDNIPSGDGVNPNPNGYSATQKNGIYIHRSNNNGYAGGNVSTGCLLIVPSTYNKGQSTNKGWDQFNNQLKGLSSFHLILRRK